MTPQVNVNGMERAAQTALAAAPLPPVTAPSAIPPAQGPTYAERQGYAMGWVSIGLGLFLLFGGLALWAAAALNAGFVGWLISMGVMGLVIVAVTVAVNLYVLRPRH